MVGLNYKISAFNVWKLESHLHRQILRATDNSSHQQHDLLSYSLTPHTLIHHCLCFGIPIIDHSSTPSLLDFWSINRVPPSPYRLHSFRSNDSRLSSIDLPLGLTTGSFLSRDRLVPSSSSQIDCFLINSAVFVPQNQLRFHNITTQ